MLTRREILSTASIVAASTMTLPRLAVDQTPSLPLYKIIADENFELSTAFAGHAATRGADIHVGASDITSFWFHDLEPLWRHNPRPIAGLTTPEALFCLERLAWDHGMRVITRTEHRMRDEQVIEHSMQSPAEVIGCMDHGCKLGGAWPVAMADALLAHPRVPVSVTSTLITQRVTREQRLNETLVSWLIALPHRA